MAVWTGRMGGGHTTHTCIMVGGGERACWGVRGVRGPRRGGGWVGWAGIDGLAPKTLFAKTACMIREWRGGNGLERPFPVPSPQGPTWLK